MRPVCLASGKSLCLTDDKAGPPEAGSTAALRPCDPGGREGGRGEAGSTGWHYNDF